MPIPRIYQTTNFFCGQHIPLDPAATHKIRHVLRMRLGDQLYLFNGQGSAYQATITEFKKDAVVVHLQQFIDSDCESPLTIHLHQAIIKHMDWVVQKATELGVASITPLLTEYTQMKHSQLAAKRAHWQRIVIHACEQCGRNRLPTINTPINLSDWLQHTSPGIVLDPKASHTLATVTIQPQPLHLLIGPEGGLTTDELALLNNWQAVRLGPRILRAETAALSMVSLAQHQWGDLN